MIYRITHGPRSFHTLLMAYSIVTWGADEPDVLRCHPALIPWFYAEYCRVNGMEIASFFRTEDGRVLHFMNATIKPDTRMPHNEVKFENTRRSDKSCGEVPPGMYHCKVVFDA